ncbi:MAG: DUF3192 domain-containing protein [Gemmatimonadota bacterium]|jgi:hypothetical protein
MSASHGQVPHHPAAAIVALALIFAACASAGGFRETNRENLERLRPGMTRDQVFDVMGTESVSAAGTESAGPVEIAEDTLGVNQLQIPIGGPRPLLQNPHRSETYEAAGYDWEVLFYYTRVEDDDGRVTDDELTPVVLRDGTLVGIGWEFWAGQASSYSIPARIPPSDSTS